MERLASNPLKNSCMYKEISTEKERIVENVYRKFDISKAEAERLSVHLPPAAVRGIFSLKMDLKRIRTNVCFSYRQEQEDVV